MISFGASGCDSGSSTNAVTELPTTTMQIAGRQFVIEKAVKPGDQEKGLMRRDGMPADHGMIFIFPAASNQHFWNHDVRFALDNVFLDDSARIVSIQQMKPYDEVGTDWVVCRYVIELNEGAAAKLGLKIGDQLTLPADAK